MNLFITHNQKLHKLYSWSSTSAFYSISILSTRFLLIYLFYLLNNVLGYFCNLGFLRYGNEYCKYGKIPFLVSWGSPVAWVSSRKWYLASIQLWKDQAKRGLNNVGQVNLKRLLFKQKGLWPARPGHLGMPHKCLKWTPRWTMPKTRRCLWCNGL